MKKLTQSEIILKVLRKKDDWLEDFRLVKVQTEYGWLGSDALRVCRKLEEQGKIEKRQIGKYVEYKAKGPTKITEYRVNGEVVAKKISW